MKYFFVIILLVLIDSFAQTYTDIPTKNNVLVVFNNDSSSTSFMNSKAIKNYYISKRSINLINTFALNTLPNSAYSDQVRVEQNGELIRRNSGCAQPNGYPCDTLAWQYYEDYIAAPIRNYLNNTIDPATGNYLRDQIRYIVLCKGIPIKIQSGSSDCSGAYQNLKNISVDAMLSILNTNSNNNLPPLQYYTTYPKANPYYKCDLNFTMDYRFRPNFFTNSQITK